MTNVLKLRTPRDVIRDALEAAHHALDVLDPRGGKLVHPPITEVIDETRALVEAALVETEPKS